MMLQIGRPKIMNNKKPIIAQMIENWLFLLKERFVYWMRNQYFKHSKKIADLRAHQENCLVYVYRTGALSYKLISSRDYKAMERRGMINKDVDFMKKRELADYVATPGDKN